MSEVPDLRDLEMAVAAHEASVKGVEQIDQKLLSEIAVTRHAITDRRARAQSGAELDACNALLGRLRKVYAP